MRDHWCSACGFDRVVLGESWAAGVVGQEEGTDIDEVEFHIVCEISRTLIDGKTPFHIVQRDEGVLPGPSILTTWPT